MAIENAKLKAWREKFDACLVLEFSNPAYFRAHHIFVMTFMLQTGRYTDAYRNEAISLLKEFLKCPQAAPTKSSLADINSNFSSDKRQTNIFRKEAGDILYTSMTILDVDTSTAEQYFKDVIAWAREVALKATTP